MKVTMFQVPISTASTTSSGPSESDIFDYQMARYSYTGGKTRQQLRYRRLEKDLYLVEMWLEYCPKKSGVLGRQRSVLVSRYHMRRTKTATNWVYEKTGKAELWNFAGKRRLIAEYTKSDDSDEVCIYSAEFDQLGRLTSFEDRARYDGTTRMAKYMYDAAGRRRVIHWRGRYHEKSLDAVYDEDSNVVIRRNDAGAPLDDNGDWAARTFRIDGTLANEEFYIAGKKHGFDRAFNKYGRVILETYWHRGVEIPDWFYLDPKAATPEEIVDADSDELRAAMLELQGREVFQIRMMARSMKAVSRARITEAEEMSMASVSRPKLTEV